MAVKQTLILFIVATLLSSFRTDSNELTAVPGRQTAFTISTKKCEDSIRTQFLGIDVTHLYVREKQFSRKDKLYKIFAQYGLDKKAYKKFIQLTKDIPGFEGIKAKDKYYVLTTEGAADPKIQYLAYKLDVADYLVVDLRNEIQLSVYEKPIDTVVEQYALVLEKSLYKTFKEKKLSPVLIEKLDRAFQNKISMSKLKKGDTLKFIYESMYVNGDFYDFSNIRAASIHTPKNQYYVADYFIDSDNSFQYVDDAGKYLKTSFLRSPVGKCKIVSKYNLKRFHPILQEVKAHLGTDFAAPQGAPIYATAAGVVEAAAFTQNNGYFVKIRHDKVYETQYLHMCKFAKGIRKGTRVQQGQVIGYVGSTGLATGPHVCYRFWKKGVQVDPLKQKLNVVKHLPESERSAFQAYFAAVRQKLDKLALN
jgi:murein DD-endopeptidase MepM/ murein hydrolase activator NlpD